MVKKKKRHGAREGDEIYAELSILYQSRKAITYCSAAGAKPSHRSTPEHETHRLFLSGRL